MANSAIVAFALLSAVACVAGHGGGHKQMKCKGQVAQWESMKETFSTCAMKAKEEEGDKQCKMGKMQYCIMTELKMLDEGKFDKSAFEKFFEDLYPGEVGKGLAHLMSEKCATEENIKALQNPDKCVATKPLVGCVMKHKVEYCGME